MGGEAGWQGVGAAGLTPKAGKGGGALSVEFPEISQPILIKYNTRNIIFNLLEWEWVDWSGSGLIEVGVGRLEWEWVD